MMRTTKEKKLFSEPIQYEEKKSGIATRNVGRFCLKSKDIYIFLDKIL